MSDHTTDSTMTEQETEWNRRRLEKTGTALCNCSVKIGDGTASIRDGLIEPFGSAYGMLRSLTDDWDACVDLEDAGNGIEAICGEAASEIRQGLPLSGYAEWNYVSPDGDEWVDDEEYWDEYMRMVWKHIEGKCDNVESTREKFLEDDDSPNHELFERMVMKERPRIAGMISECRSFEDLPDAMEDVDGVIQEILEKTIEIHAGEKLEQYEGGK